MRIRLDDDLPEYLNVGASKPEVYLVATVISGIVAIICRWFS